MKPRSTSRIEIRRGDVFQVCLEGRPGPLERPVIVLQNDIGNQRCPSIIVAPLSRQRAARRYLLSAPVRAADAPGLGVDHVALLFQIFTLDREMFLAGNRLGSLDPVAMEAIDRALCLSLGLSAMQRLQARAHQQRAHAGQG